MRRLAIFVIRRRWWVIAIALVALPLCAVYGLGVHDKLSSSGFEDPGSESSAGHGGHRQGVPGVGAVRLRGRRDGEARHGQQPGGRRRRARPHPAARAVAGRRDVVVVLEPRATCPSCAAATRRQALDLRRRSAAATTPSSRSRPGSRRSSTPTAAHRDDRGDRDRRGDAPARRTRPRRTSTGPTSSARPFTFVALVIVFGGLIAAVLPLGVGLLAVLGTFVMLTLLAKFTTVSVFSLNLATGLGLGLAIDYSLFVVSRYREELARGVSPPVAIGRSMQTAGRTVAFSAGTVAISLMVARDLPGSLPAFVRVRGSRGRRARGGVGDRRAARGAGGARPARREGSGSSRRTTSPTAASGGGKPNGSCGIRCRTPSTVSLVLVLLAIPFFHLNLGALRRPGRAARHEQPRRHRPDPRALREPRGRRAHRCRCPSIDATADHAKIDRLRRNGSAAVPALRASTRSPGSTSCSTTRSIAVPPIALAQRVRAAAR